jgi:hypothetical protein
MKVKKLKLLFALFLSIATNSYAMPDLPQPQPRGIPPVGDPVPIDSEIVLLFVAGILLGIFYFLRKSKSTV